MEGTQAPEQVIINGQEYSPEDATRYIDLGRKYQELEGKLNTSLDKVYPEYTRLTQEKKSWEEGKRELEELKAKQQVKETQEQTPDDVKKARQAARELGLADESYLKEKGYMTRDEVRQFISENQTLQQQTQQILRNAEELERKIDGSDGRVPFDREAVLIYANGKQINDLEEAYNQMNTKGNARWKEAQLAKEQRPGLTTLKPGGGKKEPSRPRVTDDNLGAMLGELINGIAE